MKKVIMGILPGNTSVSMFEVDFDLSQMKIQSVKNKADLESLITRYTCRFYPECVDDYFVEASIDFIGREHLAAIKNALKIYNDRGWVRDFEEDDKKLLNSLLDLHIEHISNYDLSGKIDTDRLDGDQEYYTNPYTT